MKIVVIGGTGLIGSKLVNILRQHRLTRIGLKFTRRESFCDVSSNCLSADHQLSQIVSAREPSSADSSCYPSHYNSAVTS